MCPTSAAGRIVVSMPPRDFGAARITNTDTYRSFSPHSWWAPHRGVRLPDDAVTHLDLIDAALAVSPRDAVVSGPSCGVIWRVPLPIRVLDAAVEITISPGGFHVDRPGLRCRRRDLHPDHVAEVDGRRVTTPARLVIDLGEVLDASEIVAVGDDLLRRGLLDLGTLRFWAHRLRRRRGIGIVREAIEYIDPRAESPRESMMRYHLWREGYTDLRPNVDIHDPDGRFIARGDLVDERRRIVVEYDGAHHLSREGQTRDARRRLDFATEGWLEVTIVAGDLYPPSKLLTKVARAYQAR